ncbi:hypothetical protein EX30DRAFT_7012 [Ascodesmis nigricans]|uniref:Uncharacterized protein n=1 Tax=Ascodesmis nigricans TaxID=341454 RepID=A0A4S2N616_9PEZI|nr:hypothetical protein EX30DRAFT_7012 [Ascodesmis nigricans]
MWIRYAIRYTYYQCCLTLVLCSPGATQPCSNHISDPLSITHLPPAHRRLIETHINIHPPCSLPPLIYITSTHSQNPFLPINWWFLTIQHKLLRLGTFHIYLCALHNLCFLQFRSLTHQ